MAGAWEGLCILLSGALIGGGILQAGGAILQAKTDVLAYIDSSHIETVSHSRVVREKDARKNQKAARGPVLSASRIRKHNQSREQDL